MTISARSLVLLAALASAVPAADAPAPNPVVAPAPGAAPAVPAAPKKEGGVFDQLAEEEKWVFDPQINRKDIFYDLEAMLALPTAPGEIAPTEPGNKTNNTEGAELEALRVFGKAELSRIEGVVLGRKWDDALKYCELDLKKLQSHADDPAIAAIVDKIKRYQTQAEEAKIYEEAQAKFDALGLRIEGILWSATGSLAVISGEPRARAINDRVKDCVIISIDTNRVDFLFHYNRRRFEFQRYVGEDVTPGFKSK
jgi:hypothetical protein